MKLLLKKSLCSLLIIFFLNTYSYAENNKNIEYHDFDNNLLEKNDYYYLASFLFDLSIEKLKIAKVEKKELSKSMFFLILSNICLEKIDDEIISEFWKVSNLGYIKTNTSWEKQRKLFQKLDFKILESSFFDSKEEQDLILKINKKIDFSNYLGPIKAGKVKKFPKEKLANLKKIILSDIVNLTDFDNAFIFEKKKPEIVIDNTKLPLIDRKNNIISSNIKENKLIPDKSETKITDKKPNNEIKPETTKIIKESNLDNNELFMAKNAWQYFEKTYQPKTGLFDSALYYDKTTMWDVGSSLAGIICANKLNIIDNKKTDFYLGKLLNTLKNIKLYNNELPNREYNTSSALMTSSGVISKIGDGWSALDIGRLLIWLKITEKWYPNYKNEITKIVSSWNFKRLSKDNKMNGILLNNKEILRQEGRLGYEQYSASGFYKWNVIIPNALDYDKTKKVKIWDTEISVDNRNLAYLTSESFFLAKMELGKVDNNFEYMLEQIYNLQKRDLKNIIFLLLLQKIQ